MFIWPTAIYTNLSLFLRFLYGVNSAYPTEFWEVTEINIDHSALHITGLLYKACSTGGLAFWTLVCECRCSPVEDSQVLPCGGQSVRGPPFHPVWELSPSLFTAAFSRLAALQTSGDSPAPSSHLAPQKPCPVLHESWDSNSGPHAWITSTLPTEPSLQPDRRFEK